jgi:hypothetical protein
MTESLGFRTEARDFYLASRNTALLPVVVSRTT